MASFRSRVTSTLVLGAVGILTSVKGVAAHGGHEMSEKIQDGEATSPDPLVRWMKNNHAEDDYTDGMG